MAMVLALGWVAALFHSDKSDKGSEPASRAGRGLLAESFSSDEIKLLQKSATTTQNTKSLTS